MAIGIGLGDRDEVLGAGILLFGSLFAMLVDSACLANEPAKAEAHAASAWSLGLAHRGRMLNATLRFH